MSWQVGAFGLLAIALIGGFAWYERTRPDARIVALVGTLAAFAALGRIAFAAVPNVKPTTDIVLIAGYALGGGPGFAVGALAALSSNFFFGQGPWTPWQMAAWGATGVIGAALAWGMRGRVIGRWPLAAMCGVVGFAFTAFQDVGDWVTYSDHSLAQLGAYVGSGLGFDAIHALGCVAFALAMGPALIRSVQRFATRLSVIWEPPASATAGHEGGGARAVEAGPADRERSGSAVWIWRKPHPLFIAAVAPARDSRRRLLALAAATLSVSALVATSRAAVTSPPAVTQAAAAYLLSAQNRDGGFGAAPGQPSNQLFTGWAALGLASAGDDLDRLSHRGAGVTAYIAAGAGASDPGSLERTILVVGAAGQSARHFAGRDLVAELERRIGRDGAVSDQVNLTAFAVLALRSAGAGPATLGRPLRWLARQADRDGGFDFATAGGSSDVDDTGAALEALAGDPSAAAVRAAAVAYLRRQQDRDGGFPSQPGTGSNAQSTAWAIQGLDAVGVSPATLHRAGAPSPLAYLDSLQAPDGLVRYSRGVQETPVWVTAEALMAMEGKPLPIAAPRTPAAWPVARAAPRGAGSTETERLIAAAGVLTAVLLAPLGLD